MTQSGIRITVQLNQQQVCFKQVCFELDTGAEVTAISHTIYEKLSNVRLEQSSRSLVGPARQKLDVLGQFTETLSTKTCTYKQTIFVMKDLRSKLLGLPAIFTLNLIVTVAEVTEDYSSVIQKKYSKCLWILVPCKGSTLLNYRQMPNHMLYVLHLMFLYSYARRFTQN